MTLEEALAVLDEEKAARQKTNRMMGILVGVTAVIFVAIAMSSVFTKADTGTYTTLFSTVVGCMGAGATLSKRAKSALQSVVESKDPRLLGHLIEAMTLDDKEAKELARPVVCELLQKVDDESRPLDIVQHKALIQLIASESDYFAIAAVRALRHIGRRESFMLLEPLSQGKAAGFKKPSQALQNAALNVLPDLRIRLAKEIIQKRVAEVDEARAVLTGRMLGEPASQDHEHEREAAASRPSS